MSSSKHTTGVGTGAYASPEQISRSNYNEKTDVFSLGIILFELFSPPFETHMERAIVLDKIRAGELPRSFIEAFPHEAALVRACTSEDPRRRPKAVDILMMEMWAPTPSDISVAGGARMHSGILSPPIILPLPTSLFMTAHISPAPDSVPVPREQLEEMQRRIAELEGTVHSLNERISQQD
jgi:serine/threonine protein kinase